MAVKIYGYISSDRIKKIFQKISTKESLRMKIKIIRQGYFTGRAKYCNNFNIFKTG